MHWVAIDSNVCSRMVHLCWVHDLGHMHTKTNQQNTKDNKMYVTVCALQDPYRSQLESLLTSQVLPLFQSPHGHLRAKAAWLAKEFADIHAGSGPLFNALLQAVINGLNDGWVIQGFSNLQPNLSAKARTNLPG